MGKIIKSKIQKTENSTVAAGVLHVFERPSYIFEASLGKCLFLSMDKHEDFLFLQTVLRNSHRRGRHFHCKGLILRQLKYLKI